MATQPADEVITVCTAFELIETIETLDGARLTDLSEELGLAKSTVHRHLQTLERRGYLVREDGEYHVGLPFFDLGIYARNRVPGYQIMREKTRKVAEETGELAVFVYEEHGRGYLLSKERGPNAAATETRVGEPIYLHASAGGKAILAHLGRERVDEIIEQWRLPGLTDATITDREDLFEELMATREDGYAFSRSEYTEGLYTVAVPVIGEDQVLGAMGISGPANRMKGDRLNVELRDYLLGAVNELELNIAYG